jgi:YD repeat-containing protein
LVKIADNHFELRTPYDTVYVYRLLSDAGYTIITGTLFIPTIGATTPCLIEIRDPHGQSLTFDYNSNGDLITITDALGVNDRQYGAKR